MSTHGLDALFGPASVALVGASERAGSVGAVVMRNLLEAGFAGPVLPVNPKYAAVRGVAAVPSAAKLAIAPDLAVVCTPARTVAGVLDELAERGTRAAVVLTAGVGADALAGARRRGMRVLGPNCLGLLVPGAGLNASFAHVGATAGELAFVSQSGAMCTAVLDWARERGIGFSAFVSLGDSLDVSLGDAIDHLGADPRTRGILLYVESVGDARRFLSAARAAARNKPIVAVKAGRVAAGERAARSHTGAMAGADEVVDYALRRAGVLRVDTVQELFDAVETLQRAGPLAGGRLAIVTNGGGPGVMAVDAYVRGGGAPAVLGAATLSRLDALLPPTWSRGNPVDVVGDASAERYAAAARALLDDPGVDALLALHAPTALDPGVETARALVAQARGARTPVLACWLGGAAQHEPRRLFAEAGVASYETPEDAVRALSFQVRHRAARELLMRTPPSPPPEVREAATRARAVVARALADGPGAPGGPGERAWLTGPQATDVLAAYGVPIVPALAAADADEAAERAAELGFPAALKLSSPDVLHKSDVGGVALDLPTKDAVREAARAMEERLSVLAPGARLEGFVVQPMARRPDAHELIVGAAVDPVFGPFVLFGQGGVAVELYGDRAVALPPLDLALADELIGRTRIARLLAGYRGRPPADVAALRELLVRVSELVAEVPEIVELDVNPVLLDSAGALALDARIAVRAAAEPSEPPEPPEHRLAIRPYPRELEESAELSDGRRVLLRPIRPDDEPSQVALFHELSPEDVRFRFFHLVREMPHSEFARTTQIDYDREMAFVAVDLDSAAANDEIGVVRAAVDPSGERAEFAVVVAPAVKGRGLGRALVDKMIRHLRSRGVRVVEGRVLAGNHRMLRLAGELGFEVRRRSGGEVEIALELTGGSRATART